MRQGGRNRNRNRNRRRGGQGGQQARSPERRADENATDQREQPERRQRSEDGQARNEKRGQQRRRGGQRRKPENVEENLSQQDSAANEAIESGDKPRKRPNDMKRGEPKRRPRNRGRKPADQAQSDLQALVEKPRDTAPANVEAATVDAVATEPVEQIEPAAELKQADLALVEAPVTPEAAETKVEDVVAPTAEISVAEPDTGDAIAEPAVAEEPQAEVESSVEEATEPTTVEEEQPTPAAGLTSEGRASNDPRVQPRPVVDVAISTAHPTLFTDRVAPPVVASGKIAPRAENDPRGPIPAQDVPQAAAQS